MACSKEEEQKKMESVTAVKGASVPKWVRVNKEIITQPTTNNTTTESTTQRDTNRRANKEKHDLRIVTIQTAMQSYDQKTVNETAKMKVVNIT